MSNELSIIDDVITKGDLAKLEPKQRILYYKSVCDSIGLNPLTKPFDFVTLQGKMTLYARKDATDQLRKIHGVSIRITSREKIEDIYVVTAQASTMDGRVDESVGAVNLSGLKGDMLANAIMKAETKAKRRVTLSIAGLGLLDENETETIPHAKPVSFDIETGEIVEPPKLIKNDPLGTLGEGATQLLSVDQVTEIGDIARLIGKASTMEILNNYNVVRISEIPAEDYERAKSSFNKRYQEKLAMTG